ncbi:glycosyltransferase family 4 protein [Mycobacteroides abscessus]|uniref:glycosyltransferase family 4 protein n=1 Tax=Mycobacteroides abscessus TaxID=36809 RepID=UPI000241CD64|nr:glycosyltransferase [Mycobacteroides abscessus subsp. bolletii BD]
MRPIPVRDCRGLRRASVTKFSVDRVDLLHALDVDLPLVGSRRTVATIHDLAVFDVPWAFSKAKAVGERLFVKDTLRRADVLIAVSDFTAERIHDACGRDAVVTPLAPASWAVPPADQAVAAVRAKYALPDQFVLQIGTVEPRKQAHLVAAAAREVGLPCVLAGLGSTGPNAPAGTVGLGYVDLGELPALYGAATIVAYASVYEGFGLPPVEAMACGATVVASAVGALPDVVDQGAVLVSRPRTEDWAAAFRDLAWDPDARQQLRQHGRKEMANLTWARTAELTAAAYQAAGLCV